MCTKFSAMLSNLGEWTHQSDDKDLSLSSVCSVHVHVAMTSDSTVVPDEL